MTEMNDTVQKPRPSWVPWMHVAGIAYPLALWIFVLGLFLGAPAFWAIGIGVLVFTVATAAFIGGIGRYLATKS